ncbi:MAG: chloride channel protein [Elusimicrobiaceae bacterium]|nr:chloride channel protein [Elusimicrobiaceae bacterium]
MFKSNENSFLNIVKWFFLATFIGAAVGVVDAAFLKALDKAIAWRNQYFFFYFSLPFSLYIVWLLAHKAAPKSQDHSTDAVIEKINSYRPVDIISAVKSLVLSIFTMTIGGSAGKEAPCADAGAGVASLFARFFRMNLADQRKMMICGVSAGFAGVFGVPISGALFGLEVLWVGHIFYEVMFPAFIAGITAFQVTTYLGVDYLYHPMNFAPVFAEKFFLKVVVAGLFFGFISILFTEIQKFVKIIFRFIALRTSPFWRSFIGGVILVIIGLWISPLYLGLGLDGFEKVLAGAALENPFGFLIKSFTTAVTFAAGGVGGIVTPIFFVGAQAGATIAGFLGIDTATMAALGLVAVLAGTANTPLSASIMAIELFGAEIAPYAAVTCVISFLLSGRQSVYGSQRVSLDKKRETAISKLDYSNPQKAKRAARKGMVLKTLKQMSKHLIPDPKGFDDEK